MLGRRRNDEDGASPARGLLARRSSRAHIPSPRAATPADRRIARLATDAGEPVDQVLREVADFRLALETDLLIAAAAADADEDTLVAEVLDGERRELALFRDRLLGTLATAGAHEDDDLAQRRAARTGPSLRRARYAAAAAAVIGLISGGTIVTSSERAPAIRPVSLEQRADAQLGALYRVVQGDASPAAMAEAAHDLHATLSRLIDQHADGDGDVAVLVARLLEAETRLIHNEMGSRRSASMDQVLNDARRLARRLRTVLPANVLATVAPLVSASTAPSAPTPQPQPAASPAPADTRPAAPQPKPSPTASSAPSGKAQPSSAPEPSSSPSASASQTSGGNGGGDGTGDGTGDGGGPLPPIGP